MNKKILVIGSGSWGTALANHLATNGNIVDLYVRNDQLFDIIKNTGYNQHYLPQINLNNNLSPIKHYKIDADLVFIAVPSSSAIDIFQQIATTNFKQNTVFVICTKGFVDSKPTLLSTSFSNITSRQNFTTLYGPNFAYELAIKQPTVTTIASNNKDVAQTVIDCLNNDYFTAKYSADVVASEICAILKNIMAIGCGLLDGFDLGSNAKAALICRGTLEIELLCKFFDTSPDFSSPACIGDIFLTCSSMQSRNYSLGYKIAKNQQVDPSATHEGAVAAAVISDFADRQKIKLDLCKTIAKIIACFNKKQNNNHLQQIKTAILQ
jgi:glycerol-3-phosphate dehydrogenase (NAD(P)+)